MIKFAVSSPAAIEKFVANAPTVEKMNAILQSLDREDKASWESAQRRMENYYNCIDDYSFGGICDRAAAQGRCERDMVRSAIKHMLETGENLKNTYDHYFLADMDGNPLTDRCVDTRFGKSWIIKADRYSTPTWVSVAKTIKTYNKKGYRLMKTTCEYEYYYVNGKNGWRKNAIITNVTVSDVQFDVRLAYNYELPLHIWIAMQEENNLVAA